MSFHDFKRAVQQQFSTMQDEVLFRTSITGDELWQTYLGSFPEGTNLIYRKRTQHDCLRCRQFIKTLGAAVSIRGDELVSIWDVDGEGLAPEYRVVAKALAAAVKYHSVMNRFMHDLRGVGVDKTFEQLLDGQQTWEHFSANLAPKHIMPKFKTPAALGRWKEAHDTNGQL